jgi:hypothetical protein
MQKHTVLLDSSTMLDLAERYVLHLDDGDLLMWKRIFAAVKESCERLQTDYVDVFQACYETLRCRTKLMSSVIDSITILLYGSETCDCVQG